MSQTNGNQEADLAESILRLIFKHFPGAIVISAVPKSKPKRKPNKPYRPKTK